MESKPKNDRISTGKYRYSAINVLSTPLFSLPLFFFFFQVSHFLFFFFFFSDPGFSVLFHLSGAAYPFQFTETLPIVLVKIPLKSHFMLSDPVVLSPFLPHMSD